MIQPVGYLKLWRELGTKPIWLNSTPEQKVILITLLMKANFKEKDWEWKGEKFKVKPGQFITSIQSICEDCGKGVTPQNIRTALKRFEKYEFLTNESTKTGRLVTIVNWEVYQPSEENQQTNQQTANKELTNDQQRANKELTTREEGNKGKKVKKGKKESINTLANDIFNYHQSLNIVTHRSLTQSMKNSIEVALKDYSVEELKTFIDRHKKSVDLTVNDGQYKVRPRGLDVFFSQKIDRTKGSPRLFEEYLEGGSKYEKYIKEVGEASGESGEYIPEDIPVGEIFG